MNDEAKRIVGWLNRYVETTLCLKVHLADERDGDYGYEWMWLDDICKQAADMIESLSGQLEQLEATQPKWISVKDNLPDDFKDVLVYCSFHESNWLEVAHQFRGNWWKGGKSMLNVSYWMPLPEPPKGGD